MRGVIFYSIIIFLILYGYYERETIITYFSGTEGESAFLYYNQEIQETTVTRTISETSSSSELGGEDLKNANTEDTQTKLIF